MWSRGLPETYVLVLRGVRRTLPRGVLLLQTLNPERGGPRPFLLSPRR